MFRMSEEIGAELAGETASLFGRVFHDYLGLTEWFKTKFKIKIKGKGRTYVGKEIRDLWRDLLGPYYKGSLQTKHEVIPPFGSTVVLKNVQLTNFVPRCPGAFHTEEGYKVFRSLPNACKQEPFSTIVASVRPSKKWISRLKKLPEYSRFGIMDILTAVRTVNTVLDANFSLSDVKSMNLQHLLKSEKFEWGFLLFDGQRCVSVRVDAKSGRVTTTIDTNHVGKTKDSILGSQYRVTSGWSGVVRFKEHRRKHLLSAFPPIIDIRTPKHRHTRSCPVELGFPVLMEANVYNKISEMIDQYGCVFINELTGSLRLIPEYYTHPKRAGAPVMEWSTGVPQVGLYVGSQLLLKKPGTPTEALARAWTIASIDNMPCYFDQTFKIGVEDYEYSIKETTDIIKTEMKTLGTQPKFDFDEIRVRFPKAKYGTNYFLNKAKV